MCRIGYYIDMLCIAFLGITYYTLWVALGLLHMRYGSHCLGITYICYGLHWVLCIRYGSHSVLRIRYRSHSVLRIRYRSHWVFHIRYGYWLWVDIGGFGLVWVIKKLGYGSRWVLCLRYGFRLWVIIVSYGCLWVIKQDDWSRWVKNCRIGSVWVNKISDG